MPWNNYFIPHIIFFVIHILIFLNENYFALTFGVSLACAFRDVVFIVFLNFLSSPLKSQEYILQKQNPCYRLKQGYI